MPRPRAPSRMDPLSFPVFAMSWYGNPGTGQSIIAYCGGGGSARTGVNNSLVVLEDDEGARQINTGEQVGVSVQIYANPRVVAEKSEQSKNLFMVVALGKEVVRYRMPEAVEDGRAAAGEMVNVVAVNALASRLAVGCESGLIKVYDMDADSMWNGSTTTTTPLPLFECATEIGHTKTITALSFSMHGGRLATAGKDGLCCVWDNEGQLISKMTCTLDESIDQKKNAKNKKKNARPARPQQVMVRGCAFGDLQGKVVFTAASGRKGSAFLSRWVEAETKDKKQEFICEERTWIHEHPISAMCMSQDGGLLTLGSADGTIILWGVQEWKSLKQFPEVHDLPVTCIAARPYPVPLKGEEEDGVQVHARSASADSQMGCLTLMKRAPKQRSGGQQQSSLGAGSGIARVIVFASRIIWILIYLWILSPFMLEVHTKCSGVFYGSNSGRGESTIEQFGHCLLHKVVLAPHDTPGVSSIPY